MFYEWKKNNEVSSSICHRLHVYKNWARLLRLGHRRLCRICIVH